MKKDDYIKLLLPELLKDSILGVQIVLALGAYHFGMVKNNFIHFIICVLLMFVFGFARSHYKTKQRISNKKSLDSKKEKDVK